MGTRLCNIIKKLFLLSRLDIHNDAATALSFLPNPNNSRSGHSR